VTDRPDRPIRRRHDRRHQDFAAGDAARCERLDCPFPLAALFCAAPSRGAAFALVTAGAYIDRRASDGFRGVTNIDQIMADFELLDDWEDRYRYVIELGKGLEPLAEAERTEANKVRGCASQVWVSTHREARDGETVLHFVGDSDALIVRGLVAIVIALFDRKLPSEIVATDAEEIFGKLDLRAHLTAQRSNGLRALVDRIRADAEAVSATA
jgi:cysteine desulfuration protein SufE